MPEAHYRIEPVRTQDDLEATRTLFRAYADSLGIDLAYQGFEDELASLPDKYSPPTGELFLALNTQGDPVGCVGLRPLDEEGVCEMKRLYVAPEGRGLGLGAALMNATIEAAKSLGYQEMRLDTLPTMAAAISLYQKAGFTNIPPYYPAPEGNIFMSLRLRP